MTAPSEKKRAFELLESAMDRGFPVRPKDVLVGIPSRNVASYTRAFAAEGGAVYRTSGNVDWLVPLDTRIELDEFHFIQSPELLDALVFVKEARIFTQKSLFEKLAAGGKVTSRARKLAARLWHLDLIAFRSSGDDGEKYFAVTPKGRKLLSVAQEYRMPAFSRKSDRADLSKFHTLLDIEPVRDP